MAEEAASAPAVDASAPAATTEVTEPVHTNGETSSVPKDVEEIASKQATTEVTAPDGETTEVAEAPPAAADDADTAPASSSKKEKRKSIGGIPEHKNKKLNKKKSMPSLHLECKPGELYWAKLKGYPQWPSVICDEQMLPESLLATRPVSTARPDGSIREDFKPGGKNAKERTFPIMFLSTNEFTWMINTSLEPLEPEQCQTLPKSKMTKALSNAWKIASESHDLDYFKSILKTWQEEEAVIEKEWREEEERLAKEAEARAVQDAEDAEKAAGEEAQAKSKPKPKSRKSKGGDDDVEMEDADAPKSTKKRKKEAESEGEGAKPKKTPKTLKLNAPKTPNGESSTKKSAAKSKKKVVQPPKEDGEDEKPQLSESEKLQQREKAVLYLRHRLQKGFLNRDVAPLENEMAGMADFFAQLEAYENLEPSIIRVTKVHKVLKAIVKLASIPKEEQFNFKKRCSALLAIWNKRMEADGDAAPASATELKAPMTLPNATEEKEDVSEPVAKTNGEEAVKSAKEGSETHEGAADIEMKAEVAAEQLDEKVEAPIEDPAASTEPTNTDAVKDAVKDVAMADAVAEEPVKDAVAATAEIA